MQTRLSLIMRAKILSIPLFIKFDFGKILLKTEKLSPFVVKLGRKGKESSTSAMHFPLLRLPAAPVPSTNIRHFLSALPTLSSCFCKAQPVWNRATILSPACSSTPFNFAKFRSIDWAIAGSVGGASRKFQFMASPSGTEVLPPEQLEKDAKFWEQVQAHQKAAAKLPHIEEAHVVIDSCHYGTLSTISQKYEQYPVGSLVQFAADSYGRPILAVSTLSPHTKDLQTNSKCSLMVPKNPQSQSSTIVTIVGEAFIASEQEWGQLRSTYLKKYPDAFWVDFGDFRIFRIEPRHVRYVSGLATGFAAVADFSGEEFKAANIDAIAQFSIPISSHMNKDHAIDTQQIVEHSVGVKVDYAKMLDLDRLGFSVNVAHNGQPLDLRIPFPRPAQDRKDVKTLILEMLQAAREAE